MDKINVLVVGNSGIGRAQILKALAEHHNIAVINLEDDGNLRGLEFDTVVIDEMVDAVRLSEKIHSDEYDRLCEVDTFSLDVLEEVPMTVQKQRTTKITFFDERRSRGKGRKNKPWEHHFGRN